MYAHRKCLISAEVNIQTCWVISWSISWETAWSPCWYPHAPAPPHSWAVRESLAWRCVFLLHSSQLGAAIFGYKHFPLCFWPLKLWMHLLLGFAIQGVLGILFSLPALWIQCWLVGRPCRQTQANKGHSISPGHKAMDLAWFCSLRNHG